MAGSRHAMMQLVLRVDTRRLDRPTTDIEKVLAKSRRNYVNIVLSCPTPIFIFQKRLLVISEFADSLVHLTLHRNFPRTFDLPNCELSRLTSLEFHDISSIIQLAKLFTRFASDKLKALAFRRCHLVAEIGDYLSLHRQLKVLTIDVVNADIIFQHDITQLCKLNLEKLVLFVSDLSDDAVQANFFKFLSSQDSALKCIGNPRFLEDIDRFLRVPNIKSLRTLFSFYYPPYVVIPQNESIESVSAYWADSRFLKIFPNLKALQVDILDPSQLSAIATTSMGLKKLYYKRFINITHFFGSSNLNEVYDGFMATSDEPFNNNICLIQTDQPLEKEFYF